MKRHIPGALLFAALVALAILVNSVVSRLSTDLDVVSVPPVASEQPLLRRSLPIRVETAEFDLASNKLVARLIVDGAYAESDSRAAVTAYLVERSATGEGSEFSAASIVSIKRMPGNKGVARFEATVNGIGRNIRDRNLYVSFRIDPPAGATMAGSKEGFSELRAVVYVHGKNSTQQPDTLR